MPTNVIDATLDEVAINQLVWKNQKLLDACLLIALHAIRHPEFWPDAISPKFSLSDDDKNLVGSAWRICSVKLKIIKKTDRWRRSEAEHANGRIIFQYRLENAALARAFVKRHRGESVLDQAEEVVVKTQQLGLGLDESSDATTGAEDK